MLEIWTLQKLIIDFSAENLEFETTKSHFYADQVLPRVLAHDGDFVLHAGASILSNYCILIVGPSGKGKSTLVTSLNTAGFALMGDDALIISVQNGTPFAKAVYPSLRLFPDSIAALFDSGVATTEVAHYTPKQRIDVTVSAGTSTEPKPILAMFMLAEPDIDKRISLSRMSIADTCMSLVENSFALDPSDLEQAAQRLKKASALASQVPAFLISYPRDYARLPDVREAILAQCLRLG